MNEAIGIAFIETWIKQEMNKRNLTFRDATAIPPKARPQPTTVPKAPMKPTPPSKPPPMRTPPAKASEKASSTAVQEQSVPKPRPASSVPKPTSSVPKPTSAIERATAKSRARFPLPKQSSGARDYRLSDPQVERIRTVSRNSNMETFNPPHAHAHNYPEHLKDKLLLYGEESSVEVQWKKDHPEGLFEEYLAYLNEM